MRYLLSLLLVASSLCGMESQPDPLLSSIAQGNLSSVNKLISEGRNPRYYNNSEPMRVAFKIKDGEKRASMVHRLLEEGADPNGRIPVTGGSGSTTTLLGYAARQGWKDESYNFLVYGADPNGEGLDRETVLIQALRKDYIGLGLFKRYGVTFDFDGDIVKALLVQGADPFVKSLYSKNAVDFIFSGDADLKDMLQNFERYKTEHPEEFEEVESVLDQKRFRRFAKPYGGIINALRAREGRERPLPPSSKNNDQNALPKAGKRSERDDEDNNEQDSRLSKCRSVFEE